MKKLCNIIKNNKHCLLLLYWPIYFIWYQILKVSFNDSEVLMIHSSLDDKIPFCEWFIIPYVFWYGYIAIVLIFSLIKGRREFLRADLLLTGSMLLPIIFCTIIPNGIELSMRPDFEALGRSNWAIELVKLIYEADSPPRNVMPSMHVSAAWALMLAVLQSKPLKGRVILKSSAIVMSILISLATVFIKQHSVLDVFAGIGTALLVFVIVFIAEKQYDKKAVSQRK